MFAIINISMPCILGVQKDQSWTNNENVVSGVYVEL